MNNDFSDYNSVISVMNISHEKKKKTNYISEKYDTKVSTYKITNASENEWENYSEYVN